MVLGHVGPSPWEWHPHPDVWLLIALLTVGYWLALTRVGPTQVRPGQPVATRRQVVLYAAGVATLWVHADWPIHDIGEHYLFSVHMFQHIGFTLVSAPLLLVGTPTWLFRWMARARGLRFVLTKCTRPAPAAAAYNVALVFTHWPPVVNAALTHHALHFALHVLIVVTALVMWFPFLNKDPMFPRMSEGGRLIYLFLQSVIPTIPASFLTFGSGVLYHFYATAPRPFPIDALDDQQVAGALMKLYAGLLLWGVIAVCFFRWYEKDSRRRPEDVLTWDEVQEELARTEPAPVEPARPGRQ
ncbi:MAG TPA: cytochrome c oxidase assembly protein [Acidimicrobiales bacterium]|nr:cytochrome c oxidase assembly protein [Acidimicrobiales bacterium]